jgi:ankyrin repeat protein
MKYLKMFEAITESKIFNAIYKNPNIDIKYAKKLISTSSKSDLDYQDPDGKSALLIAAYKGRLDIVKKLIIVGANLNIQDSKGNTPLMLAIYTNEIKVVKELINGGVDVNIKNMTDCCAIHLCNNIDILKVLIKAGADVNAQDGDGDTVLIYAANNEDLNTIKLLIHLGANVDIKNYDGDTALVFAAFKNNMEIINLLLKNKNKIDISDYYFIDYLNDENQKNIIDNFPKIYKEYQFLKKSKKYNLI